MTTAVSYCCVLGLLTAAGMPTEAIAQVLRCVQGKVKWLKDLPEKVRKDKHLLAVCQELQADMAECLLALGIPLESPAPDGEDPPAGWVAQCIEGQEMSMLKDFKAFLLTVRLAPHDACSGSSALQYQLGRASLQEVLNERHVPEPLAAKFRSALWTFLRKVREDCRTCEVSGKELRGDQGALERDLESCVSAREPNPEAIWPPDRCAYSYMTPVPERQYNRWPRIIADLVQGAGGLPVA